MIFMINLSHEKQLFIHFMCKSEKWIKNNVFIHFNVIVNMHAYYLK